MAKKCTVVGCNNKPMRGWTTCNKHYVEGKRNNKFKREVKRQLKEYDASL